MGKSSIASSPKYFRKSSEVPYKIGLPVLSSLPTSITNLLSISVSMALSLLTPRIASISDLIIGCLYAIMDKTSSAALDKFLVFFCYLAS